MEEKISLVDLFKIIKKRLGIIISATLLGLLLSAGYTFYIAVPQYSSTTQLLVNHKYEEAEIEMLDIDTNVQLITTYTELIQSPAILTSVIEELGSTSSVEELSKQINVTTENDSQLFSIHITSDDPTEAAQIANTIPTVFKEHLQSYMDVDNVVVVSEASVNSVPVSPINMLNMTIGVVIGGIIGASIIMLLESMDTTIKDEKYVMNELGWANLGSIPTMTKKELRMEEENSAVPQVINEPAAPNAPNARKGV